MALQFSVAKRKDMRKGAAPDSKLFYGVTRASGKLDINKLCDAIAGHSTASRGDVMLVLEGLIYVMTERLQEGAVIQMGNFGNFAMVAGSSGSVLEADFTTSLFKRPRIVFRPGPLLRDLPDAVTFEKMQTVTVVEACTKEHVI